MKDLIDKLTLLFSLKSDVRGDFKTSQEWLQDLQKVVDVKIEEPEGWDQFRYDFSFNQEQITKQHFVMRILCSKVFSINNEATIKYKKWCDDVL